MALEVRTAAEAWKLWREQGIEWVYEFNRAHDYAMILSAFLEDGRYGFLSVGSVDNRAAIEPHASQLWQRSQQPGSRIALLVRDR